MPASRGPRCLMPLVLAIASVLAACSDSTEPTPIPEPWIDLTGEWAVAETALYTWSDGGGLRVAGRLRRGTITVARDVGWPSFTALGVVADTFCSLDNQCDIGVESVPLQMSITAVDDELTAPWAIIRIPRSAVTDSSIDVRITDPASESCRIWFSLVAPAAENRACHLAVHWRRLAVAGDGPLARRHLTGVAADGADRSGLLARQ